MDISWEEGDYRVTETEWHTTMADAVAFKRRVLTDPQWLARMRAGYAQRHPQGAALSKGAAPSGLHVEIRGPDAQVYEPFNPVAFERFLKEASAALKRGNVTGEVT